MKINLLARRLGYAGLIPFIVFSLATWWSLPGVDDAHRLLTTYAAIILSFMGAVHWGVAMSKRNAVTRMQLGLSVLPALLGWLALSLPLLWGYCLFMLGFLGLYLGDQVAARHGLLPDWYLPMRVILTGIVLLCLLVALLSLLW